MVPATARKIRWSRAVIWGGTSTRVKPYGYITRRPDVWNEMWTRILWRPSITRLSTKSRIARASGVENGCGPANRLLAGSVLAPPQQAHVKP